MKSRWVIGVWALLGAFVWAGCSEGTGIKLPPSTSSTETRNSVERPFGLPKNLQKIKPRKGATNAPTTTNLH
jgi:hypothetical protein